MASQATLVLPATSTSTHNARRPSSTRPSLLTPYLWSWRRVMTKDPEELFFEDCRSHVLRARPGGIDGGAGTVILLAVPWRILVG
jgi:hypothetical protein